MPPSEVRHRRVGELTLAYRQEGAGPPLFLLHGAWSDSREWRLQCEDLADDFTVVCWDAPGCGESSDPPDDITLAGYADAVAGLIRELGHVRPHVLGLSFGGGLALELYRRHPEIPRSLILASAYAGWKGSLPEDVVAERVERALEEATRPPADWVASYLPGFFAGPVAQPLVDEVTEIMLDVRPAGTIPMVRAFAAADLRESLGSIDVPTLLLYGEQDSRAPAPVAEALHAAIPDSTLVFLPGVGHMTNIEAPRAFNDEVRRFLSAVDSG